MESQAKETSPSPAGTNRLKSVLTKGRRGKKENNASNVSIAVTENSSEGTGSGPRNSIDSLRASRKSSLDDGKASKMAKLIPSRMKRKKIKQEEAEAAERQQEEDEEVRGRDTSDQTATAAAALRPNAPNRSHSTLDGDEGSSLMTVDSEADSPLGSPPPLVSRQSHAPYLTASSPLIKTATVAEPNGSASEGPPSQPHPQKSTAYPTHASAPTLPNVAPGHAATLGVESQERSSKRNPSKDGRGISPGERIKDIFSGGLQKKDKSSSESPERDSDKPNGTANAPGLMIDTEKRNSMSSRKSTKPSDIDAAARSSQVSTKSPTQSLQSLPQITTSPKSIASTVSEAPATTITPPTPTDQLYAFEDKVSSRRSSTAPNGSIAPAFMNPAHRRVRSDSATHAPSRLSNSMAPPLTPMVEEIKTPGGRTASASSSPGGGGFFSSVFSAAQNAATNLSDIIANNPPRPRSATPIMEETKEEQEASLIADGDIDLSSEKKPLAIDTLGSGELSLSHLGIALDTPATDRSTSGTFPSLDGNLAQRDEAAARAEGASAARAVSAAYSDAAHDDTDTPVAEDNAPSIKPRSIHENSIAGEKTPPTGSIFEGQSGTKRSSSVRSKVGAVARRKRNSSTATAGTAATIAAASSASHAGLANSAAAGSTPKLTGFAVANKKRNRDFHQSFRSVPEDDYLIEDYSCALQREIILAGRIYISEGHICFSSNILGWVTTLIISFDEVVSVEKENTAMVFPNAIAIQTLHARHTFRSLLSREATYDLIIGIWKLSHPNLKSTLNGAQLDKDATGDKTIKVDSNDSDGASDVSDEDEEVYDEDEDEDEGDGSYLDADCGTVGSEAGDPFADKVASRKASAMGVAIGAAAGSIPTVSDAKAGEKAAVAAAASADFPGPATHAPTECTDGDTHYEKILKDEVIPAPLGKVYSMVFGPASGGFMSKWLLDEIKVTELQMEDRRGLSEDVKTRTFSYIKPLYASIGPKSTKCIITESLDFIDLERSISVTSTTQTPDVPSGNVFSTKTKFCFMWASGNSTRMLMSCTIEWTGKSWLKGPIEKGANDGQTSYANDLVKALKAGVTSRPRTATMGSKTKIKGKRPKGSPNAAKKTAAEEEATDLAKAQDESWGLLEPLHGLLGPVVDIFKPFISANMIIGFLLFIMILSWLRGPKAPAKGQVGFLALSGPERIAAYEEMWRKEESGLWDWLEERIGMQDGAYPASSGLQDQAALKKVRKQREKSLKGSGMQAKLAEESMNQRQMDHAIETTEERLKDLKAAVQRRRVSKDDPQSREAVDQDA